MSFAAGQGNLYGYVGNDPVNNLDPYGLENLCKNYPSNNLCQDKDGNTRTDTYPERAKEICNDFYEMYEDIVPEKVEETASCLIDSENANVERTYSCEERNVERLDYHIDCYLENQFFEPFNPLGPGLPEGGAELGWKELWPDFAEDRFHWSNSPNSSVPMCTVN